MNYDLAIELGSKYTSIYKAGTGVVLKESSLIAVKQTGKTKTIVACGDEAKKLVNKTNTLTEVIAPIENGAIKSLSYAKAMLKEFLLKLDIKQKFLKSHKIVFCLSCGLNQQEKKSFKNLAYSLNINVVAFVPQAVTSLIGMGVDINSTRTHMVVNVGGNITDIAIVNGYNIIKGVSVNIGGEYVDKAIVDLLRAKCGIIISENMAEEIKKEIASLHIRDKSSYNVSGIDVNSGVHKTVLITANDIYSILFDLFSNIAKVCETVLNNCASDVVSEIINVGMYVCGGMAHIYGLENFLSGILKMPVYVCPEPESTTILGCGFLLNNPTYIDKISSDIE